MPTFIVTTRWHIQTFQNVQIHRNKDFKKLPSGSNRVHTIKVSSDCHVGRKVNYMSVKSLYRLTFPSNGQLMRRWLQSNAA